MDWKARVELFEQLRQEHEFGVGTIAGVAAKFGVHRRMVRQAIAGALPPPHRYPARVKPKLDAVAAFIDQVLDEDRRAPRKQRHTARRIYRRILTEFPDAGVAESTVRNHVRNRRRVLGLIQRETFVPQSYVLGYEAQVDWYEAWADLGGERTRMQVLAMRLMASGAAFHRAYLHATQQAFLEAHEHAFAYFGGVFRLLRYDNLASAVRKILRGHRREETVRFVAFRSHWRFTAEFCTPGEGHEKGGVEGEGGYFRRNHLVPVPGVADLDALNAFLLTGCRADEARILDGRSESVGVAMDWRRLVMQDGEPNRRLYEMAVFATLRDKLRSGDIWVERSSNYRRFDSYLLPEAAVPAAAAELKLPATADEWLATRGQELDRRLRRFSRRLPRGDLDGVEFKDDRLQITPVKATATPEARAFADGIEAMMPRARITEVMHDVNRATGLATAFTNLRTGENCEDENALLAAILADATNLGLGRMAAASHGVTRDKLVWTADAYIRPETYKAALAKIIDAHHALPIASIWGDGTTSSSDQQFFRSGKRGDTAGDVNARYGVDPGLGFYTHVSDQHGPYNVRVMSATSHEAPLVLDGMMHHGTALKIGTHYTDTGGASDHVFILCAMLGFRFCPRLRDFPDRKLACIEPVSTYKDLQPLLGRRIKTEVIREHWSDILRLVASLQAGTVLPSVMLKRLTAFQRQSQLDLALQELGRIERTLFMLDWLESPQLRQLCQAGLNKSEQRHVLAQVICTFKQGRIADRGQDAQQFRASGLNLVIAAIVHWNSTYLADAIDHMMEAGKPLPAELLAHTSPLTWEHIGFSGDFLWDRAAEIAGQRRALNLGRERMAA